ncbi:epidermis-specific secreted glycoprotein EP1-like [Quillaja saponaria]|uniref:Epidermis-specific secreted glycoprotein EP1-like n=1 Tax=Quillaja saponaria TaxID=32244 RepID=A0AAD7VNF6_QUISA|nr:epidermis-specific secreted glycoprotein EP1-like [Quillaja saponaria]
MASSLPNSTKISLLSFFLSFFAFSIVQAFVPQNETFKFVNEGEFGPYIVEYDGNYRMLSTFNHPFQLGFYNTTPNAFTLALRMGVSRSESVRRWVWEANRGNPVGEKATLTFGTNGNLVLADANGSIAWQTNTANKGIIGLKLLPNGNMVLYDSKGNFVWQSFDYPTDTLLVGQSLWASGLTKLVSRASEVKNIDGPFSFVLEPKGLALYYKSKNSPRPILYFFSSDWFTIDNGSLQSVTFNARVNSNHGSATDLALDYKLTQSSTSGGRILSRPKYDATLTFLRLGIDGNIRLYTYDDNVDWNAWEVTYTLFDGDSSESECQLPSRCGAFGLCEDNNCVACPLSNGLFGWSKDCKPKALTSCRMNDFHYYKLEGVDHFMSKYTRGDAVSESECGKRCTKESKCLGYFYHREKSKCWIAYDLKTLSKVTTLTNVGYIKVPNH